MLDRGLEPRRNLTANPRLGMHRGGIGDMLLARDYTMVESLILPSALQHRTPCPHEVIWRILVRTNTLESPLLRAQIVISPTKSLIRTLTASDQTSRITIRYGHC